MNDKVLTQSPLPRFAGEAIKMAGGKGLAKHQRCCAIESRTTRKVSMQRVYQKREAARDYLTVTVVEGFQ